MRRKGNWMIEKKRKKMRSGKVWMAKENEKSKGRDHEIKRRIERTRMTGTHNNYNFAYYESLLLILLLLLLYYC